MPDTRSNSALSLVQEAFRGAEEDCKRVLLDPQNADENPYSTQGIRKAWEYGRKGIPAEQVPYAALYVGPYLRGLLYTEIHRIMSYRFNMARAKAMPCNPLVTQLNPLPPGKWEVSERPESLGIDSDAYMRGYDPWALGWGPIL